MVFWKNYTISSLSTSLRFESECIYKKSIASPTGVPCTIIMSNNPIEDKKELCQYIRDYFGNPPHTPVLDIPEQNIIQDNDYAFIVRDDTDKIVGSIRYHYVGTIQEKIYVVDCFCIHPRWRKKGVGDYLLIELHRYSNELGRPYALFLKEGYPLSNMNSFYSSYYLYRMITCPSICNQLRKISITLAKKLCMIYQRFYPDRLIVIHPSDLNQEWYLFEQTTNNAIDRIMVCVQDSYQTMNGKRMAWMTAWLETPGITQKIRERAANAVADSLYPEYGAVWLDHGWLHFEHMNDWIEDGAFHWYTYQWNTSLSMENGYALIM